jgi:hypothetical protein
MVSPLVHNMFGLLTTSTRTGPVIRRPSPTTEYGLDLVLKGTNGALHRLADRTIVWTHVQFAVTGFGSPLIAMDSALPAFVNQQRRVEYANCLAVLP